MLFLGIRSFRRQCTKEEKLANGFSFEESIQELEEEGEENVDKLMDDLESTKQLLELEVRSKKLLEKDNKRLQAEMEKLKQEFSKLAAASGKDDPNLTEVQMRARRNSIATKRQSMIKLLSEDEDDDFMTNPPPPGIIFVPTIFCPKKKIFTFSQAHSHASTNATRRHEYFR